MVLFRCRVSGRRVFYLKNKLVKKLIAIILVFIPLVVNAQVQTLVQKGIVRSQSFASQSGKGIVGAIIARSGNDVNPAISQDTPEDGYFELSMDKLGGRKVYYIESVEGPKGTRYKLLYPRPNDKIEFTPNAPLTIIMQSNEELDKYVAKVKEDAKKEAEENCKREIEKWEKECEEGRVSIIERDQMIEELQQKLNDFDGLFSDYIYETLKNTDFERLDSLQKEISIALEAGDVYRVDSLLNLRPDSWWRNEHDEAKRKKEKADRDYEIIHERTIIDKDQKIECAFRKFDFGEVLSHMKDRLYYDSTNVNYLCQLGALLEIRYNEYRQADVYYQKALSAAINEGDNEAIAICHNHLGNIYNNLSEYKLAEEHYKQALVFLEQQTDTQHKDLFDTYLGLGNIYYSLGNFHEALKYFNKCAAPDVKAINSQAYWQGKIGIGQIKLTKGDYYGARDDFSSIIKVIASSPDDIETYSMAYISMIECMTTIGQYQEAIDSCDAAIGKITTYSSPKNTYIAGILTLQGTAFVNIGKIQDGKQCMNQAIDIYRNILGENHPNYANACVQFADYYSLVGDLNKSKEMSEKALELFNQKFGRNHIVSVGAHISKCNLFQTCAKFDEAQAELDTIRTIYKSYGLLNDYCQIQISSCEAAIKSAQGEPANAIRIFQTAIECVTKTLGKDAVQLIGLYNQLAMAHLEQLENDKAKVFLDKAIKLANTIYGDESPIAIMQQMEIGQYYINKGEYHIAYELYSKIKNSAEDVYGSDNYQLCRIYDVLGDYHLGQYQFDKANLYYEKYFDIVNKTYGSEHYFIAAPISKIGAYLMNVGDFFKGLEKEQQAYNILSTHFGIGHKETLMSLLGVCSAYIQLGQFDQAESNLSDLSIAVEKEFGKTNLFYSNVLQKKAELYQVKGEFIKAIECAEEAINIIEGLFGKNHSNSIALYQLLGTLYSNMCDFPRAIIYNDLALSIATTYYGKDNIGVMPILLGKGVMYASLNQFKEAHKIYDKVKDVYVHYFGDSCKQLCTVSLLEGLLLCQEGYGERAVEILKKVEVQMKSMYGESSVQMCSVYNSLADAYLSIMQYELAREYYQKSHSIVKSSLGNNNINSTYPLVGLANVCLAEDVTGHETREASSLLMKASLISAFAYGSNNLNTASIDAQLGQISLRQGNLNDAFNKFQKYSSCIRETLGDNIQNHTRIADAHMNMGYYYLAKANESSFQQNTDKVQAYATQAMGEFENAKRIAEAVFGAEYAGGYIATSMNAIAQIYFILQDPDSAIATYVSSAEMTIIQFGKQSPLAAQAYAQLGAAYKSESDLIESGNQDKLNAARENYEKAISIRENTSGSSREVLMTSTMDWRMALVTIYVGLNDYGNAFKIIDKIISELEELNLDNKSALYNCYYTKAGMIVQNGTDIKESLELLLKAKELSSQISFPNNMMKAMQQFQLMTALGNLYEQLDMIKDAILCYESSYKIMREFPNNQQVKAQKQEIIDKIDELKQK